jgi:hypothetical protein
MTGLAAAPTPTPDDKPDDKDARAYVRIPFRGAAFAIRIGKGESTMRLRDLSRQGAAGLIEFPLAVGDYLIIELDNKHLVEAQVRWVRRVMVGLQFSHPVKASLVTRLYQRHVESAKPPVEEW